MHSVHVYNGFVWVTTESDGIVQMFRKTSWKSENWFIFCLIVLAERVHASHAVLQETEKV